MAQVRKKSKELDHYLKNVISGVPIILVIGLQMLQIILLKNNQKKSLKPCLNI